MAEGTGYCVENLINNEWQEYTIKVRKDGIYDIVIYYSSGLTDGNARIVLSFPDEDRVITDNFKLYDTFVWSNFMEETIASEISLTKGKHILRVSVVQLGYHLDWIEIKKSGTTNVVEKHLFSVSIFPNPSNGVFTIQLDGHQSAEYTSYNIAGVKIQSGIVDSQQKVEFKDNKPGIYLLEVNTKHERKVLKVVAK